MPEDFLDSGIIKGKDAVRRWFEDWFRAFQCGYRAQLEEACMVREAALVVVTHHGRGRTTDAEAQARIAYLCRVREGRIARIELYRDYNEALEVGFSEQDAHTDS